MSRIITASREINNQDMEFMFLPGSYLENELRGAMSDFLSYVAANPQIPLSPVRVKIIVEQEVE